MSRFPASADLHRAIATSSHARRRPWGSTLVVRSNGIGATLSGSAAADLYLVTTTEGPGFAAPDEVIAVLENGILPTFAALADLQKRGKIVAGGLPAGSRTLILIMEAESHDEVDRLLRDLPAWGVFSWTVKPLQSLGGRADMEREILRELKAAD